MKVWVMLFTLAIFAGGACLGVTLDQKVIAKKPAAPASSEHSWSGHRYGELSVTRFTESLALTEEQNAELDRILEETRRDVDAYGRAIRATHDRSRERVMGILSDDQKNKLEELLAVERRKRSEDEGRKAAEGYAKLLGLTPEQTASMAAILAESRERKRAAFADRKPGGDREEVHSFFKSLREEQDRKLEKALTPEQFRKYVEIRDLEH
jgi:Spy/CpxP family protein refolding chaperone